ncbi:MAG: dephospho-CoA kinase [Dehalococcoidales bacterium]|nr:dephospho-CoA kinase [Dehalococcoidales bacterium]
MKVIGLTGGIGSGKSTVARFMAERGAVIIDADKIGHRLLKAGSEGWREVVSAFGKRILTPRGNISRKKLGDIVFSQPESRLRLNRITHHRIGEVIAARLKRYRKQGIGVVVVEAAVLVDAGWDELVDEIWVTVASEATVLRRLRERTRLSTSRSLARIHSQLPVAEMIGRADVVIDTDCSLDELKTKVKRLWLGLETNNI